MPDEQTVRTEAWPVMRRRFVTYGALGVVWVVGISTGIGLILGGVPDAVITGTFLLVGICIAYRVAYLRLRRKYARASRP